MEMKDIIMESKEFKIFTDHDKAPIKVCVTVIIDNGDHVNILLDFAEPYLGISTGELKIEPSQ